MIRLVFFELLKIFKSKKNRIVLLIYSCLILMTTLSYVRADKEHMDFMNDENIKSQYQLHNSREKSFKDLYDISKKEKNKANYEIAKRQANLYKSAIDTKYKSKNYRLNFYIKLNEIEKDYSIINSHKSQETNYVYAINFYKYMQKNNITLIEQNDVVGYSFLLMMFKDILPIAVILIPILICFDIFTLENENGSIKFLLLQPYSRGKYVVAKFLAGFLASIIIIFLPIMIMLLLICIIYGFGDGNYPMLCHENSYKTLKPIFETPGRLITDESVSMNFITRHSRFKIGLSEYYGEILGDRFDIPNKLLTFTALRTLLLRSLPLLFLSIILNSMISLFISSTTQSNTKSIIFNILFILFAVVSMFTVGNSPILSRICPYYYSQATQLISGMGIQTALSGVLVIFAYIIILFITSILTFRKRDVKC